MHKYTLILITCFFLSSCAGMGHISYKCKGHTKSDLMGKFGPPERVNKGVENSETWEYTMGGGVKTYTFQGEQCVRQNSRTQN